MSTEKHWVKVAVISAAHGVRGEVKLHSLSDTPEDILTYPELRDASGRRTFKLTRRGITGGKLIAAIEGIKDRNAAEALKGTGLFAASQQLPAADNQFHYADLIGLAAHTPDGRPYATITGIANYGAGDILELELTNGQEELLPFTSAFVGDVDTKTGHLVVFPPSYIEVGAEELESPED